MQLNFYTRETAGRNRSLLFDELFRHCDAMCGKASPYSFAANVNQQAGL